MSNAFRAPTLEGGDDTTHDIDTFGQRRARAFLSGSCESLHYAGRARAIDAHYTAGTCHKRTYAAYDGVAIMRERQEGRAQSDAPASCARLLDWLFSRRSIYLKAMSLYAPLSLLPLSASYRRLLAKRLSMSFYWLDAQRLAAPARHVRDMRFPSIHDERERYVSQPAPEAGHSSHVSAATPLRYDDTNTFARFFASYHSSWHGHASPRRRRRVMFNGTSGFTPVEVFQLATPAFRPALS